MFEEDSFEGRGDDTEARVSPSYSEFGCLAERVSLGLLNNNFKEIQIENVRVKMISDLDK